MKLQAIDKLYSREDIMNEVKRHNEVFNLKDFYLVEPGDYYPSRTGYRIISSDNVYSGYCSPYSERHEDVVCNILFGMYDDYNRVYRECDGDFRSVAVKLGAVFLQLVSKSYSLMWLPYNINEFQYKAILDFASEMDDINRKLEAMGKRRIVFGVCISKEDGTKKGNLDLNEAVDYLSNIFSVKKFRR